MLLSIYSGQTSFTLLKKAFSFNFNKKSCLMKACLVVILLVFIFKPILPVAGFIANYDYIKTEICENRDRPEMHCNGKCYLKKELAKTAQENDFQSTLTHSISFPFQWLYLPSQSDFRVNLASITAVAKKIPTNYNSNYKFDFVYSLFRPPVWI